jgi:hypothetical protein
VAVPYKRAQTDEETLVIVTLCCFAADLPSHKPQAYTQKACANYRETDGSEDYVHDDDP